MHYLKASRRRHKDKTGAVVRKMRELPVNDFMSKNVKIREDGQVMRDAYLMQVKAPSKSKYPYDYYKLVETIPGERASPLSESECR